MGCHPAMVLAPGGGKHTSIPTPGFRFRPSATPAPAPDSRPFQAPDSVHPPPPPPPPPLRVSFTMQSFFNRLARSSIACVPARCYGLGGIARHVIGCHWSQEGRVQMR